MDIDVSIVDNRRQRLGFSVIGGPTTIVDIAGRRLVIDPTFDPAGVHAHLTKTAGPAVPATALGPVDAVLISHDQHKDNLDEEGRRFALHWHCPGPRDRTPGARSVDRQAESRTARGVEP